MPRGSKDSYTDKQKRQAAHIEKGYEDRGLSENEAERRAWATVNKTSGGGKKSGSGRKAPGSSSASARKRVATKAEAGTTSARRTTAAQTPKAVPRGGQGGAVKRAASGGTRTAK